MAKVVRSLEVVDREQVSPNLLRVTLGGAALSDFPAGFEGGYIKLVLPEGDDNPAMRSYTIKEFRNETSELVFDMVSHGVAGPAARWSKSMKVGDAIDIGGPGPCQKIDPTADWFLIAGDMSAVPAIQVNVETLPSSAKGYLVLEVISEQDKPELDLPDGVDVHWVINPDPESENTKLEDTVKELPWLEGHVSAWVAGEFSASRSVRQYFRHERKVAKESMYVSCYWKIGQTDEGMKAAKRADTEAW
ncbi:MAG: siderophore-interacting protein [Pseudomonadales bacterium]|nr:siderophore-interacting protein [Pseudomonadales bacterium]